MLFTTAPKRETLTLKQTLSLQVVNQPKTQTELWSMQPVKLKHQFSLLSIVRLTQFV